MTKQASGVFITLEGVDGVGKSTQATLLVDWLKKAGHNVRLLREPGGTSVGEKIRDILLDTENTEMSDLCELLLYEASRAQICHEVINPALEAGDIVICDRFYDSTYAYQGYGREMNLHSVSELNRIAVHGTDPELTLVFSLERNQAFARATADGADRLESAGDAFRDRVLDGFDDLIARNDGRVVKVDASGSREEVFERVAALVAPLIRDKETQ